MILHCSACSTRYLVDPVTLGEDGRVVRCARCGHTWFQFPPEDMPRRVDLEPPDPMVRPIPPGSNLPAFPRRRRRVPISLGWAAFLFVLVALVSTVVVFRDEIVSAWPPAARLYMAVGMAPEAPGAGLQLRNITSSRTTENGTPVLVIEGEVANVSDQVRDVPPLRAELHDSQKNVLRQWTFTAGEGRLLPGESILFSTRTENPTNNATGLSIVFADARARE